MSDMFVVNLQLSAEGTAVVRSCELLHRDFRNRISFSNMPDLFTVFQRRLANAIQELVDQYGGARNIVSNSDFEIDLPNLKLAGLTFLVSVAKDGVRQVILRFRYFIGTLQSAFSLDMGIADPTLQHKERIAIESLVDIVGPLYGLALLEDGRSLTDTEKVEVENALKAVQDKAHVLKFYSDLLLRYVRDCSSGTEAVGAGAVAGPGRHLRLVE